MQFDIWILYVGTILILMSTPGPSQLLMLSNSLNYGFKQSCYTAAGDLSANFLQMLVASLGLVSLIVNAEQFFIVVKWLGVAYLAYLGLKLICAKQHSDVTEGAQIRSASSLYWQGFVTSAANPKAIVFFAALFPQFINPNLDLLPQFLALSFTYLFIDAAFLVCYGKFAIWIGTNLKKLGRAVINKASGTLMIIAAVLLGAKDVS